MSIFNIISDKIDSLLAINGRKHPVFNKDLLCLIALIPIPILHNRGIISTKTAFICVLPSIIVILADTLKSKPINKKNSLYDNYKDEKVGYNNGKLVYFEDKFLVQLSKGFPSLFYKGDEFKDIKKYQIDRINKAINAAITPGVDSVIFSKNELGRPYTFEEVKAATNGDTKIFGDCDDYATTKQLHLLRYYKADPKNILLMSSKYAEGRHMTTAVIIEKDTFILDNLKDDFYKIDEHRKKYQDIWLQHPTIRTRMVNIN